MATTTYEPIQTQTLSSSAGSVTFTSIPQTYTDLVLVSSMRATASGNQEFTLRLNSDTGSNYSYTRVAGDGSSAFSDRGTNRTYIDMGYMPGSNSSSGVFGINNLSIMNYANTTTNKTLLYRWNDAGAVNAYAAAEVGLWRSTSAITSITLATGGNLEAGSTFTLYGIANAAIGAPKATGGIITYDNTYYYHTFGASGTFTPQQSLTNVDYLVIAGGGGGGSQYQRDEGAGGGGAGGLRSTVDVTGGGGTLESKISLNSGTAYTITVGAGGAGGGAGGYGQTGSNGANSSIAGTGLTTITSTAGGGGGNADNGTANSGGSGGGAGAYNKATQGSGTANQGYAGGNTTSSGHGAGGGGAGAVGTNGISGGAGGTGVAIPSIANVTGTGVVTYYAGGGGGGGNASSPNQAVGPAGVGGGGAGGVGGASASGSNAVTNTGGGGGGAGASSSQTYGGNGGSGVVIIRYLKA